MNLHHRPVATLDETKQAIETFLAVSKQPVLLEPGEEPLTLAPGAYHIDFTPGRLTIQAWSREQNLSRRVTGIQEARPGVLVLATERFGKQAGTVQLLDLARSKAQVAARRGSRLTYREQFHRSLTRHFPAWEISRLSTEPNLQHTLSPAYPRALLRKGPVAWAAIGASAGVPDASGILSFGLLWLDYARRMEAKRVVEGLILFVPAGQERTTCHRILCLNPAMAQFLVYVHSEDGVERQVDWRDYGNLDTKLPPRSAEVQSQPEWMESVAQLPDVDSIELNDGAISYRVRGLELARKHGESLLMGLETKRVAKASNLAEIEGLARELARMRSHRAVDRQNSLYQRYPELWLESRVRTFIQEVDASLQAAPIYGQVPAFAGGERGVIDLLAVDCGGRLAVLELKAAEDIHLPLQALDYWIRVKWHLEQGDFRANGYFPGIQIVNTPPRILLVGPSLAFHPSIDVILRFFSPDIPVTRVGLAMNWRERLKVVFQNQGGTAPAWNEGECKS